MMYTFDYSDLESGLSIKLSRGKYDFDIIGGWYVKPHNFEMELISLSTGMVVKVKERRWLKGMDSRVNWNLLKQGKFFSSGRIIEHILEFGTVKIEETGVYKIKSNNHDQLEVYYHRLWIDRIWRSPVDLNTLKFRFAELK